MALDLSCLLTPLRYASLIIIRIFVFDVIGLRFHLFHVLLLIHDMRSVWNSKYLRFFPFIGLRIK